MNVINDPPTTPEAPLKTTISDPANRAGVPTPTLFFVESRVFFFDNRRPNLIARHPDAEPEVAGLCPLHPDPEHRFGFDAELCDRFKDNLLTGDFAVR